MIDEKTIIKTASKFIESFQLSAKQARKIIKDKSFLITLSAEDLIYSDYPLTEDNIKAYYSHYTSFERKTMNRESETYPSYRAAFLKVINTSEKIQRYQSKKDRQKKNNEYMNTNGAKRNSLFNMFEYAETGNTTANWPVKKLKAGSKIAERTIRDYKHALKQNREELFNEAVQYAEIMLIESCRRTKIEKRIKNDEKLSKIPNEILKEAEARLNRGISKKELEQLIEKSNKASLVHKVLENVIKEGHENYTINPERSIEENIHCLLFDFRKEEERYRRTHKPLEIVFDRFAKVRADSQETANNDRTVVPNVMNHSRGVANDRPVVPVIPVIDRSQVHSQVMNCSPVMNRSQVFASPYRNNYVENARGGYSTTLFDGLRVHVAKLSKEDEETRKPIIFSKAS